MCIQPLVQRHLHHLSSSSHHDGCYVTVLHTLEERCLEEDLEGVEEVFYLTSSSKYLSLLSFLFSFSFFFFFLFSFLFYYLLLSSFIFLFLILSYHVYTELHVDYHEPHGHIHMHADPSLDHALHRSRVKNDLLPKRDIRSLQLNPLLLPVYNL